MQERHTGKPGGLAGFLRQFSFYPLEYTLMLAASLLTAISATGLIVTLVGYWLDVPRDLLEAGVLLLVAALVIALPAHLVLYWRVRRTDTSKLTALSVRWANAMLAVYVFVLAAAVLGFGVLLIVAWLNVPFGVGQVDKNLAALTISTLLAALWLKLSALYFLGVRAGRARDGLYTGVVLTTSLATLILAFAFPAREYRDAAIDIAKSNDLSQIDLAVNAYVDDHGELPASLQALGLQDLRFDADDYQYKAKGGTRLGIFGYELCADFAKSSQEEAELPVGFYNHEAGKQCFVRFAVSADKLRESLESYYKDVEDGARKLAQQIAVFLDQSGRAIEGLVGGVEGQIRQLEQYLEGVEGGTEALQKEMQRLEDDIVGSAGVSEKLEQDFDAIEKFFHDLFCGLDPKCRQGN